MFLSWFFNAQLIDVGCGHLVNMKKAEAQREAKRNAAKQSTTEC